MNLDDAIVLETFSNRIEAELAAGLLESEGIEAIVMADDAGGHRALKSPFEKGGFRGI